MSVPPWQLAAQAAALFAVDPAGLGGVALRALPGPARDRWLALLRALLPEDAPIRRVPLNISDGRLLGGLDLAATLRTGRPVVERGVLAEADGGVVLLAMAERLTGAVAARVGGALDTGAVRVERDGLGLAVPARFGVVALDEGAAEDERLPASLLDRLSFPLDLSDIGVRDANGTDGTDRGRVAAARLRLAAVAAPDAIVAALCGTSLGLGIDSARAPLLALRAARAAAALAGRTEVLDDDARLAAVLVLAPRATMLPAPAQDDAAPPPPPEPGESPENAEDEPLSECEPMLDEIVLSAAQAAIPPGLLAALRLADGTARSRAGGKAGAFQASTRRGRPAGVRRGEPRAGARLNVVETLRAAAPWQRLRQLPGDARRVVVLPEDFHVTRYRQRSETTTIFVVDASGSAALNRLGEVKGAVELVLADCYIRRDHVALIAFRGRSAELLLPPTRALVRAKRALAGLPGGGATPLATAIDAAAALADAVRRRGQTPAVVLLSDGRANIARDGAPGRPKAEADALAAARRLRAAGLSALFVDTAPRPLALGVRLAVEMGASYLPLPDPRARTLARAVQAAAGA